MTAQLQPAGTPGHFVIFQPSRDAHLLTGIYGDWMRQPIDIGYNGAVESLKTGLDP